MSSQSVDTGPSICKTDCETAGPRIPTDNEADSERIPLLHAAQPKNRMSFCSIVLLISLFCLAYEGIGLLIPQYVYHRIGTELGLPSNNATQTATGCNSSDQYDYPGGNASWIYKVTQQVQDRSTTLAMYQNVASTAAAAISIPLICSYSDRVGRHIALVLPCVGSFIESLVTLSVMYFHLPLYLVPAAAGLSGLFGGVNCLYAGALAYLADITPIESRPIRNTVLEALTGVGGCIALLLIGWWIQLQGYLIPHIICTALYAIALLYSIFLIPKVRLSTLPVTETGTGRVTAVWSRICAPVRDLVSLLIRPHRLQFVYIFVLISAFLYFAAFYGAGNLTEMYSMNYPFCLDTVLISYYDTAWEVMLHFCPILTVWLLKPRFSTLTLASIGIASSALSYFLLAIAWNRLMLWISVAAAVAAGTPLSMWQAFLSSITPADKQGFVLGIFSGLMTVSTLPGSFVFTKGYNGTLTWHPGFVFYIVAAVLCVSLLLTIAAAARLASVRPALSETNAAPGGSEYKGSINTDVY